MTPFEQAWAFLKSDANRQAFSAYLNPELDPLIHPDLELPQPMRGVKNLGTISPQVDAHRQMGLTSPSPDEMVERFPNASNRLGNEMLDPALYDGSEWTEPPREFHADWDFIPASIQPDEYAPGYKHWPLNWHEYKMQPGQVARVAHPSPYPE